MIRHLELGLACEQYGSVAILARDGGESRRTPRSPVRWRTRRGFRGSRVDHSARPRVANAPAKRSGMTAAKEGWMRTADSQSAARPRVAVEASPIARPFANTKDAKAAGDHQGHPPLLSCPSWARTRTLLIPYHFGLRRRLQRSWSGLCLHLRHHAVRWLPLQSLHLPRSGLGSALPVRVRRLREHAHTPFPTWCPAYGQSQYYATT